MYCVVQLDVYKLLLFWLSVIAIDVTDIKFVINYDFPNNTEDYIHRIGRTARAENTGTAYSLFTPQVYMYFI